MKYNIAPVVIAGLALGQSVEYTTTRPCKPCVPNQVEVFKFENNQIEEDSLVNINIRYTANNNYIEALKFTYGSCGNHETDKLVGFAAVDTQKPTKFAWATPSKRDALAGKKLCIKAWQGTCLLGQGQGFKVVPSTFDSSDENSIWRYDAVKDFKKSGSFLVTNQSPKSVGIVGAGMAGMFSALLFNQANLNYNIELIEANKKRVGGRVWTYHFPGGSRYDYYELGAMRFYKNYTYPDGETREDPDCKIVFRLINHLNKVAPNHNDKIKLIPYTFGRTQIPFFHKYHNFSQIEDGMNRFPQLLRKVLIAQNTPLKFAKVYGVNYTNKVSLKYKSKVALDAPYRTSEYDYALISAPLTVIRHWKLPSLSYGLSKTIHKQVIGDICKVLIKFEHRFWDSRIYSGQDYSDFNSFEQTIIYPSHGDSRVVTFSYVQGDKLEIHEGASDEELEMLAIEKMVERHGEIARLSYKKGNMKRYCWQRDPYTQGGVAYYENLEDKINTLSPYKNMEANTAFIGETTDHSAGWIHGALFSALRGVFQVFIKDGHIDEAKKLSELWGGKIYNI